MSLYKFIYSKRRYMATYTFTGQCYSQSGDTKKYEEDLFTPVTRDTSIPSSIETSCFYYTTNTSYTPEIRPTTGFAYYTYSEEITNNGDYNCIFSAYALYTGFTGKLFTAYVYCPVINGVQQETAPSTYKNYDLGTSYTATFCTKYGGSSPVTKSFNLTLAIMSYWEGGSTPILTNTWYTEKITFNYNIVSGTNYEYVGVYLFSIATPGQFKDITGTGWDKLGLMSLSTFEKQSKAGYDTGIATGYVSCQGRTLSNATLTVYTESISDKTSTISSKTVSIGTVDTIYVIGIRRYVDTINITETRRYIYACSDIAELTLSSWSTTKPS